MSLPTTSVLLNSGWHELPSQFTSLAVSGDDDVPSTDDGVTDNKLKCPIDELFRPDQPKRCTFSLETKSFSDSPHRHLERLELRQQLKISPSILHHIGETPLVRINKIGTSAGLKCEILAKCEFFNAGGSVKDRIALRMIEDAEASGKLRPGDTLIEPTSGNTGIGLALVAAVKGYRCVIVMPEKMSNEKADILAALGAQIVRTPAGAIDSPESFYSVAYRLLNEVPRSHLLNQFSNPSNPLAHYEATAEEILEACDGHVDMFVAGAGTGGTLTGVAMKLKQRCPNCKVIGIQPSDSAISGTEDGITSDSTMVEVEGIGYDFVPVVSNGEFVDRWYKSEDMPTFQMARRLIREEGLLCGGSSGAAMYCALQAAQEFNMTSAEHRIVVVLPDSIRNYMTKYLNDDWMLARKYVDPIEVMSDENSWWMKYPVKALKIRTLQTIHPSVTIREALELLDREGFDQVPVVDDLGKLTGMLTIGKMMSLLTKGKIRLGDTVGSITYKRFRKVSLDTNLGSLSAILNIDHYAIVVINQRQCRGELGVTSKAVIYGIVTRIDLFEFILKGPDQSASTF